MDKEAIIQKAKEIVELDIKRDELYEELISLAGEHADDILRAIQNSLYSLNTLPIEIGRF